MNERVKRIIVLAPNKLFFGANLLQLPFFQHLRRNFPQAEIIIWSPERASGMMVEQKLADKLYLYKSWKDYFRIILSIWKQRPDIIFNLRWYSEGLNLVTGLSFAKLRIGFKTFSPFIFLLNGKVKLNDYTYMARLYLDLLKPVHPDIFFYFDEVRKLDTYSTIILPEDKINICFMPGGGEGEHKRWGIDNYCRLGMLIYSYLPSANLIFITGPKEKEYVQVIKHELNGRSYYILEGGSIADIVKATKSSVLTIANDCGPSHLAQMCEVNYIGIWGWMKQHPQERIIKWTLARPNSVQIVAREGDDIKKIKPEEVMSFATGFLQSVVQPVC